MVQEHLKNLNLADEPEETLSMNPKIHALVVNCFVFNDVGRMDFWLFSS
jgi:hypothetical protein